MEIVGHGIDIVEIESFQKLLSDQDFVRRCFTEAEQSSVDQSANYEERLAAKFAAKEAVAKALGTGFDGLVAPLSIEILTANQGVPAVSLLDGAAEAARIRRVTRWSLSLSHSRSFAIASAIAIRLGS